MKLLLILLSALGSGLIATYLTRILATRFQIGSFPDPRKMHQTFMPHMGGLGIVIGFLSGIAASYFILNEFFQLLVAQYGVVILAAMLMVITGILDDVRGLSPYQKFLGQFLSVTLLIIFDCRIQALQNPTGSIIHLGIIGIPFTYLWMIGVSNAINLLDGLDGLAGGVSLIIAAVFLIAGFQNGDWATILITIVLIGSLIGFLRFNYHPASIFMGDTGSLFLGFIIAAIAIRGFETRPGSVQLIIPMIALAIPIGDTSVAFFRRLNKGHHPFKADKDHLHHRLIYLGLSHRQAVHIIYFVSLLYGISAYLILSQATFLGAIVFALTVFISFIVLQRIGYLEAQRVKTYYGDEAIIEARPAMAPLFMRRLLHKLLLVFSDVVMINLALLLTWWFRYHSGLLATQRPMDLSTAMDFPVLFILSLGWIVLFMLNNLYNMRWDISRFDQVRRLGKVIIFGILVLFIITLDPQDVLSEGRMALLLYGSALFICVNMGRIAIIFLEKRLSILEYSPHKTLLVGATDKAKKLLRDIRHNPHLLYEFVGYVSRESRDQPFSDLPFLGTYEQMPEIIRRKGVEEVIIAINERSRDEILNIVAHAEGTGVVFKIIPQFYDVVAGHKTEEVIGHPLIRLFPESMYLWQWGIKRLLDLVGSFLLLITLSPIFLLIIVMQIISNIYPPFLIINTVGKYGKVFGMVNFNYQSPEKKEPSRFGKFLYQTRIYKLPVLINILLGKMSFVGPRPQSLELVEVLRKKIKFYNRRFQVRPGMTGWAQVKYRYEEALRHQREQLKQDLFYLENMSLTFDFRIILRSLIIFLFRK